MKTLSERASRKLAIKRYRNRKLYDPLAGTYVTLPSLLAQVKAGRVVNIICSETGVDLTAKVLLEALMRVEAANAPNVFAVAALIQKGLWS